MKKSIIFGFKNLTFGTHFDDNFAEEGFFVRIVDYFYNLQAVCDY